MRRIPELGLTALLYGAPVPGLGLLTNKRLRRKTQRAAGLALLGAGALLAAPVALYVICKTSPESTTTN